MSSKKYIKKHIKLILKEYGCLHEGGEYWEKELKKQRNKELVNKLFKIN